jgi:hypothetical protein
MYMCGRWRHERCIGAPWFRCSRGRPRAEKCRSSETYSKSDFEKSTADPLIFYSSLQVYMSTHHTHDVQVRRWSVHGVPAMFLKSTRRSMRSFARDFVETGGVAQWLAGVTSTACLPATQAWA